MAKDTYALSELERTLLVLYNAVSPSVRAQIGTLLFAAFSQPAAAERTATDARFRAAVKRFGLGDTGVDTFEDLCSGKAVD